MMHNLKLPSHIQLASSYDPIAFAKIRVDGFNREKVPSADYDCPKCLNKERIAFLREDGTPGFLECDCKAVRRSIRAMKKSGLEAVIRDLTFDRFQATEPWQKRILSGCQAYAAEPKLWLLLCGQSGSGKTHLCSAICQELMSNGHTVRYMPWRDQAGVLKRLGMDAQRDALLDVFKTAPVLFIDDLFKTGAGPDGQANPTAADVNLAFEILNHRYHNRMLTILSTEKSPGELVNIDEATGSRILELARKNTYHIRPDRKKNFRLREQ